MIMDYQYKRTDLDGLVFFLLDFDFSPMLQSSDIEYAWSFLKDVILTSIFFIYTNGQDILCGSLWVSTIN